MKYINQYEYAHISYPTKIKNPEWAPNGAPTTAATSGCGPCSLCMGIDYLTNQTLPVEECIRMAIESVANYSNGTDMKILGPFVAEKFDLDYSQTDDLNEAIAHLQSGGVIVVHVGIPEGKEIGLFTRVGHYMLIISTDGKEFCFLDPSYTPDKFTLPERVGRVNTNNAPYLYCDVETMHSETKPQRIKYHLFKRAKK